MTKLEILSDAQALLISSHGKYTLEGGNAVRIIAAYQHMLTHGQALADTYLMGVIDGMQHETLRRMDALIAEHRASTANVW